MTLLLYSAGLHAQISVVNKKGTVLSVDSSKWTLKDSNIYNKNRGSVGVGTNGVANSNAALEVNATNKGLLIPRLALTGTGSASPLAGHVAGMLVYNTATAGSAPLNVSPGFYFNNGSKWVRVSDIVQADTTNDGWKEDAAGTSVKLAYLSNGATARPSGTEFVIRDDGKTGIGTSAPVWQLDVQGSLAIGHFKRFSSGSTNTGPGFLFTRSRGSIGSETDILAGDYLGKVQFRGRVGSDLDYGTFGYIANSTTIEDGRFGFFNGGAGATKTEIMTVRTDNMRVGIGNPNPTSKLSVSDTATGTYVQVADFYAPANTGAGNNTLLKLGLSATTKNSSEIRFNYSGASGSDNNRLDFSFYGVAAPAMSIQAGGNVGIANTTPAYKLHISGQTHADSTISAPNYTATVQIAATGSSYTWNMNLGANTAWTLAAGANTLSISNVKSGMFGLIKVTNAGTSTITLPAGSKVVNGGAGVIPLTQVASAVDILTFYYDGTNYWWTYGNNYN